MEPDRTDPPAPGGDPGADHPTPGRTGVRPVPVPSTDGVTLTLWDLGGEGPPLLLCHATGFCGRIWEPVARRLADRYRVWALDFRAHGDSDRPRGRPLDWEGFADDVLAVVDHLGGGPLVAAGHSKGGASLVLAEARRPGTFRRMWLYEPVIFPPPPEGEAPSPPGAVDLAEGALRRRPGFPSREAARENFASKPPMSSFHPEALEAYLDAAFSVAPDGSLHLKCRPADESAVYRMGRAHRAFERLGRVRCPVVVARGALSPGPAMVADMVAERLPAGRLEVFEDLSHFGPMEDPDRIAGRIAAAVGGP